jgi:hypothetical protein
MQTPFVRQLGDQVGVQLNPVRDISGQGTLGDWDRTVALVGRFTRGPIDRAFRVDPYNVELSVGVSPSIAVSALAEGHSQMVEALRNGARGAVVSRLVPAAAVNSHAVFLSAATSTFTVSATAPVAAFTFGVQHLGCHNDGIQVWVHADELLVAGLPVSNNEVTVKVMDANGYELHRVKGSLDSTAVNEYGETYYLPDLSVRQNGGMLVWTVATGATIGTTHDGYGKDSTGADKWAKSGVKLTFAEGGTTYAGSDITAAVNRLRSSDLDFGYIISGGTSSVQMLTELEQLAYDTNRQLLFDVSGDLTPTAAVAFVDSLGFNQLGRDHYPQAYYAPLKSLDRRTNSLLVWGTAGAQAGLRCAQNGRVNAYGLAPKHQPIAGINGALGRAQCEMTAGWKALLNKEAAKSELAAGHVNLVGFESFASGGSFAFLDVLTVARTKLAYRKLTSVAEMSSYIDEQVVRFGRECLRLSMTVGIGRMEAFLERFFGYAKATGWLVDDEANGVAAYAYTVTRSAVDPASQIHVNYWLRYDGVIRQIHVQQTIV